MCWLHTQPAAGVTRPTVYAHFPDARSLLNACSGHVRATIPAPDPTPWRSISDPAERLETALRELYGYYERLEPLLAQCLPHYEALYRSALRARATPHRDSSVLDFRGS